MQLKGKVAIVTGGGRGIGDQLGCHHIRLCHGHCLGILRHRSGPRGIRGLRGPGAQPGRGSSDSFRSRPGAGAHRVDGALHVRHHLLESKITSPVTPQGHDFTVCGKKPFHLSFRAKRGISLAGCREKERFFVAPLALLGTSPSRTTLRTGRSWE